MGGLLYYIKGAYLPNITATTIVLPESELLKNKSAALWNANKLQGKNVSTATPTSGQVLAWNASSSQWEPSDNAAEAGSTSHSDLTGLDGDDHTQYQLRSEKDQPNGYAGLDENADIVAQIRMLYTSESTIQGITLEAGRPAFSSDTNVLFIGDGSTAGGVPVGLRSPAMIVVQPTGSVTENATRLQAAYTTAKSLTPYGSALSATNRATVLVLPGVYDFGAGDGSNNGWWIDTNYIDIVGLGNAENVVLTCQRPNIATKAFIYHSGRSFIKNVTLQNTVSDTSTVADILSASGLYRGNHSNYLYGGLENVIFDIPNVTGNAIVCMVPYGGTYQGTYRRLRLGTIGSAYGLFAWGGGTVPGGSSIGGRHYDCDSTSKTGWSNLGSISGEFWRCKGGTNSWYIPSFAGVTLAGQFYDCTGGTGSFNPKFAGTAYRCTANNAFGVVSNGELTGTLYDCETSITSAPTANTVKFTGMMVGCRFNWFAGGDGFTTTADAGGRMYHCRIYSDGTYAWGTASGSVKIAGCISNKDFRNDAGQQAIATGYNVVDTDVVV